MSWEGSTSTPCIGDGVYNCACGSVSFHKHRELSLYKCANCGVTHFSRAANGSRKISPVGASVKGGVA
jgi:hypothetical protein